MYKAIIATIISMSFMVSSVQAAPYVPDPKFKAMVDEYVAKNIVDIKASQQSTSYAQDNSYSNHDREESTVEKKKKPTREFIRVQSTHHRDKGKCYMRDVDRAWYDDGINPFSNGHRIKCPD